MWSMRRSVVFGEMLSLVGDLGGRVPDRDEPEDLDLALGELERAGSGLAGCSSRRQHGVDRLAVELTGSRLVT